MVVFGLKSKKAGVFALKKIKRGIHGLKNSGKHAVDNPAMKRILGKRKIAGIQKSIEKM
tara:strand:+ start:272 stop:448 length:177 start_codon:yes stop_codon:yes gene_type:complete